MVFAAGERKKKTPGRNRARKAAFVTAGAYGRLGARLSCAGRRVCLLIQPQIQRSNARPICAVSTAPLYGSVLRIPLPERGRNLNVL